MAKRIVWTAAMDIALRALRAHGCSWRVIARALGVHQTSVPRRAAALGIPPHVRLNSGPINGVQIVAGTQPKPGRFIKPSDRRRLGKRWEAP